MKLLEVQKVSVHFPVRSGWRTREVLRAVDEVSFTLAAGETLGLVGESGCGKTTLGRAVVRLVNSASGKILFEGCDIAQLQGEQLRRLRRQFQIIFQDPYGSLDPRFTVGQSVGEALDIHDLAPGPKARRERIGELLTAVGLDAAHAMRYPHEFSGGQRQRIGLARALAVEPRLLVCDEPVSALDVSVQAQVVNLLQDLQAQRGLAYLFISHDLAVVEHLSHRILVMYLGRIVETGPTANLVRRPRHPYTQALLSAVPTPDPATQRNRILLPGEVPSPLAPPSGCPFHPRCRLAQERCRVQVPEMRELEPGHWAACHLAE